MGPHHEYQRSSVLAAFTEVRLQSCQCPLEPYRLVASLCNTANFRRLTPDEEALYLSISLTGGAGGAIVMALPGEARQKLLN